MTQTKPIHPPPCGRGLLGNEVKKEIKRLSESRGYRSYVTDNYATIETKDNMISVKVNSSSYDKGKYEVKVGWASIGSVDINTTTEFKNNLSQMISIAGLIEDKLREYNQLANRIGD